MRTSEFIAFRGKSLSPSRKTGVWEIVNTVTSQVIGEVKWYGAWRKYAFFPGQGTTYDPDCLFTIAEFLERITKEHFQ